MSNLGREIIRMENIHKSFPGVKALKGVNLIVKAGEVHALVGENGAGKSTLIKILMGVYQKDEGEIYIEGEKVQLKNPIQAKAYGLGAVYQDITLAPHLSVGENFFLGKVPLTKSKLVDWKKINKVTKEILEELDINIDPRTLVKDLTVAQQEMVTIAKTVHEEAKLIVFDEPTALLANEETEELFKLISKLKASGVGIIYISHRMEEIFKICDTVTVLKDGAWVNTLLISETDEDSLIAMMVGRSVEDMYSINHPVIGENVLEVKNLTKKGRFKNISLELHKGEILGLFGLVGSGRTDIVRCIFGAEPFDSGEIIINGEKANIKSPADGIKYGIGLLPEDRKTQGLGLSLSVEVNTNLASYEDISSLGVIDLKKESERAEKYKEDLRIKTPSIKQKVRNLSGGNQQKVVISKWLCKNSSIFIFDEPTVGVDVGAKVEIYKLFEQLLANGNSIILISSYLPEVMGLADRVMVISEGKHTGTLTREEFMGVANKIDEEKVLKLASGIAG
jgi:ribose transport system ATP-binding protein